MPAKGSKWKLGSKAAPSRASKRQKGAKPLQLQPEHAQLFRGLIFYFIPNNDISSLRKKRIEKAQEYGAIWAKEWSAEVTHVIADQHLTLLDVKKAIGEDQLKPSCVIVNENYPPECVYLKIRLPTDYTRFQLAPAKHSSVSEGDKHDSLQNPSGAAKKTPGSLKSSESHSTRIGEQGHDGSVKSKPPGFSSEIAQDTGDEGSPIAPAPKEDDELEKIVKDVKETADLPFDPEDEGFEPDYSHTTLLDSEDDAPAKPRRKYQKSSTSNLAKYQYTFSCMRVNVDKSKAANPNSRTIEKLEQMSVYYDRTGDHWRTIAYRKCIAALKWQTEHIATREQAIKIPGIGERLAMKIEEIAVANRLRRLENALTDPTDRLLQLFMGIYQVGLPTASKWIAQGYRSLEDLSSKAALTPNQKIGIDHYDDFLARIPRDQVKAHREKVREACLKADADIQIFIGGSYRRGATDSGDVDLIITKEGASLEYIRTIVIHTVIPKLFKEDFLKAALATSRSKASGNQGSKWHGASALPGSTVWRRIDLLFVPGDEIGAALLYFTGNDIFNRSMRLLASKKDMRLNQHGLYGDVMRGEKRQRITQGRLLEAKSEKRIFQILGVPWRTPEQRIC